MPVPVISITQMREWEAATWAAGESETEVIRRVGRAVAERALQLTRTGDFILVIAGKGNNGADARNDLEHLDERRVDAIDVRDPDSDFSELETLLALRPALIIDGLFGIGINRPLDAAWIKFIQRINTARLQVLAVDVPSGLDAETGEPQGAAIKATVTLTVGAPKKGLLAPAAWPHVVRLEVTGDVGLIPCPVSSELNWTLAEDFVSFPPARLIAGHKGSFGHVALIAGSAGYHGAGVLAARGAQRARPGLITLLPHESAYLPAASQLQAVMVQPWNPSINFTSEFSAMLVGPGLAARDIPDEMKQSVRRLWQDSPIAMIVDASGLDWLPPRSAPADAIRVITPHPGEAARLLKITTGQLQANRPQALREVSRRFGNCWVVLKGHQTLTGRSSGEMFVNSSGNPGLAQGGSGDLLAGYLAGLLAQPALQSDVFKTIRFGVWQHGAAADRLESTKPNWVVEDLAEVLGLGI